MATHVPQRELRNNTAALLRRVADGERLRITIHGHPVADLVPVEEERAAFVSFERVWTELHGLLDPGDDLAAELRALRDEDDGPEDPFERHQRLRRP